MRAASFTRRSVRATTCTACDWPTTPALDDGLYFRGVAAAFVGSVADPAVMMKATSFDFDRGNNYACHASLRIPNRVLPPRTSSHAKPASPAVDRCCADRRWSVLDDPRVRAARGRRVGSRPSESAEFRPSRFRSRIKRLVAIPRRESVVRDGWKAVRRRFRA